MLVFFKRLFLKTIGQVIPSDIFAKKFPVSVKAIIYQNDTILFLLNERNEWDLPGGKINRKESPKLALKREVLEETGLKIFNLSISSLINTKIGFLTSVVIGFYQCDCDQTDKIAISEEHFGYEWIHTSDIYAHADIPSYIKNEIKIHCSSH